jgi:hypothetical protein
MRTPSSLVALILVLALGLAGVGLVVAAVYLLAGPAWAAFALGMFLLGFAFRLVKVL